MKQILGLKPGTGCCGTCLKPQLSGEEAEELSNALEILAHPVRLQILDMLARSERPVCVCELETGLPVKQPTVSHHLKLLRAAGLIESQKRGLWVYYFLRREALQDLRDRVAKLMQFWKI